MLVGTKYFGFWANLQKYQTLVPAKNSHPKVATTNCMEDKTASFNSSLRTQTGIQRKLLNM
jgi:hypothetical protein